MPSVGRPYAAVLIVSPACEEAALSKFQEQFKELICRHEGTVLEFQSLGKRKLSYKIGPFSEGIYFEVRLTLPPAQVAPLQEAAPLLESFVRLMILKEPPGGRPVAQSKEALDGQSQ